ncbi:hypothetical protein [Clostridium estertheticum]|uniref:hypothetical protein n=1 Tax=Clostridium estertheticum TaxID=238834 RepID=UPI001CF2278A|nr:hypothetical protein [Clostridium estertheticum]MCB2354463.1 hypothetical protein [Clostridium estertheticum]WAG42424.1 hypothetical protein LL065_07030 [Clostridium estertheticum]
MVFKPLNISHWDKLRVGINQKILLEFLSDGNFTDVHTIIQDFVYNFGLEHGLNSEKEFRVERRNDTDEINGLIDVVWSQDDYKVLIEIDSTPRDKSLYKLLHNESIHKVWIYCCTDKFDKYMRDHKSDLENIIMIPILSYKYLRRTMRKKI